MASVTIRELAAQAGCSHATVSLALRNHPRISLVTRQRIALLAKKAGYCRDPLVASLMNQLRTAKKVRASEKLAFVSLWDTPTGGKTEPHHIQGTIGASQRASELGYEVEEFWAKEPGLTSKRLSKILYSRGIRGLIIGGLPRPCGHISLDWQHFAAVAHGYTVVKPDFHRVISSVSQGMQLCLRTLRRRGYNRIGFTSLTEQAERTNPGWLASYLFDAHFQPRKAAIPPLIVPEWDRKKFNRWIDRWRPDAVVSNFEQPLGFLRDRGYRVPEDIGYASLDRMQELDPFAGIDQLRGRMGAAIVDLVVSLVESNQYGLPQFPKILHFDSIWKDGPTICRAGEKFGRQRISRDELP